MHNLYGIPEASTELGWAIGLPLLLMVLLFAMAVPVWVSLGLCAIALLVSTEVLPRRCSAWRCFRASTPSR